MARDDQVEIPQIRWGKLFGKIRVMAYQDRVWGRFEDIPEARHVGKNVAKIADTGDNP